MSDMQALRAQIREQRRRALDSIRVGVVYQLRPEHQRPDIRPTDVVITAVVRDTSRIYWRQAHKPDGGPLDAYRNLDVDDFLTAYQPKP